MSEVSRDGTDGKPTLLDQGRFELTARQTITDLERLLALDRTVSRIPWWSYQGLVDLRDGLKFALEGGSTDEPTF